MREIFAYSLFVMIGVLPTLVPVLAVMLPLQACWLAMRNQWVMATLCLMLAGYCAALAFGPADSVPGGHEFHALSKAQERQNLGRRMMQSSSFGGTGKAVTVGELKKAYGEPGASSDTEANNPRNRR